ncbi:lantibiotic dehydratase [Kribbella sp. NPDC049227]|uniref:lantibiotic dehydratase n=1 Tax=Kribbella sp. NPDC049227 TaxID=3364113 RepID=UPI0037240D0F
MSNYRVLSGLVVRAPLLPATTFADLGTDFDAERWLADSEVEFALAVASPDLTAALASAPSPAKAPPTALAALQRYLIRAATRPTPFGAFAALGLASWAERTDLEVDPVRRPTRTRPDMQWLSEAIEELGRGPGLRVYANTCAFEHAGRIYLADPGTGGVRSGPDVSVRATPVVRRVLALARGKGLSTDELCRHLLAERPAATPAKVDRLLSEVSEQQFLLPALRPSLIGDPLERVVSDLNATQAAEVKQLIEVGAACRRVDLADGTTATAALGDARAVLAAIQDRGADLQVDTGLPLSRTGVGMAVADDVCRAADLLFRLHPNPGWTPLAGYRAAFRRRYGADGRVRLLELLDPRFGLGLPSAHRGDGESGGSGGRVEVLRELAAAAIRDGSREVVLDEELIERLSGGVVDAERLPVSVELSVFVAASNRAAIDQGDYLLVVGPNLGAQEAGRGLGRFADLLGAEARELLDEVAAQEAAVRSGDEVVAEMVYRPLRARTANVAVRPMVREYELPVGVAPTLPPDRVVQVDELSVGLVDGRFRVWWDAVDRPLVLTAGHMLNPAAAPPVCRALLELTTDGTTYLSDFDWGAMSGMPFLPRVRHGRVVLSPAQWRLSHRDAERFEAWRAEWRVPRLVYLASGDNRLLLDLDDCSHQVQLRAAMGPHSLTVQEALPGPDDGWLPGPRGLLMTEFVVPLVRSRPVTRTKARTLPRQQDSHRLRPPGSDWLYLALDGPQRTEDELLIGSLGDLADGVVERGDADGWFFVRYSDPDRQLRLRLHGDPAVLVERVLPEVTRWAAYAIGSGARTRLELSTYEREIARYGGPETTAVCEAIACCDSSAVRDLLRATRQLSRDEVGLVSIADLLASLAGQDDAERARWAGALAGRETSAGPRFRERKDQMRALLQGAWDKAGWDEAGDTIEVVLARRRAALEPLVEALRSYWTDGIGLQSPEDLAPSLVHLHANRLGLDHATEQLTLGLLVRTLRSLAAYRPPT